MGLDLNYFGYLLVYLHFNYITLSSQGIKYTIKIEDVQAIIDNVDPKPTIDKEDCACNCANLEVVVNQGNVHGKCKTVSFEIILSNFEDLLV